MGRFKLVTKFLVEDDLVKEDVCKYTDNIHHDGCDHATLDIEEVSLFFNSPYLLMNHNIYLFSYFSYFSQVTKIKDVKKKKEKKEYINEEDLIAVVA